MDEALVKDVANFINAFFLKRHFKFRQWYMGVVLVKGLPIVSMVSLLRGVSKFVNGYMGKALVKGFPILSIVSLLRRMSKFVNGYMGEALVKGVVNFVNGFFVIRGF